MTDKEVIKNILNAVMELRYVMTAVVLAGLNETDELGIRLHAKLDKCEQLCKDVAINYCIAKPEEIQ